MGTGTISIHDRKRRRYRCKICKQTFSETRGTMFEGLRKPRELIVIVVTLLCSGCPVQAIVHAFGLDERTVASWRDRAGAHCEQVHQALVESGKLDLIHVQADEIRVKGRKMITWMGLAMMVSTRLWLAGTVNVSRDKRLADALMHQVRRSAQTLRPLLVLTDGWAAYPGSIRRAFREKVKTGVGVGRASLEVWPQLQIGTVIKRTEKKRVVEISRKMAHGLLDQAEKLLQISHGGNVLNTALIERLNGTKRRAAGESHTQVPTRSFAHPDVTHRNVSDRLHVQFLLCPSGIEQSQTLGKGLDPCDGQWLDRSYLECLRITPVQSGAFAMGGTETTRTTKKAGRANYQSGQTTEPPISLSAFGSSS